MAIILSIFFSLLVKNLSSFHNENVHLCSSLYPSHENDLIFSKIFLPHLGQIPITSFLSIEANKSSNSFLSSLTISWTNFFIVSKNTRGDCLFLAILFNCNSHSPVS